MFTTHIIRSKAVKLLFVSLAIVTVLIPVAYPATRMIVRAEDTTAIEDVVTPVVQPETAEQPSTEATADQTVPESITSPVQIDTVTTNTVVPAQCGDGVKNLSSEQCDGNDFGSLTCSSLGFTGGSMVCNRNCQIEDVQCTGSSFACPLPGAINRGWWAEYFDYKSYDPAGQMQLKDYANRPDPTVLSWYEDRYKVMMRIDNDLNFQPQHYWFPIDDLGMHEYGVFYGDHNFHFGAHWRATVTAPETGDYEYYLASDDDSWVVVNGTVVVNNSSIHETRVKTGTIHLNQGANIVEVYYAERHTPEATMQFRFLDDLAISPLPEGCEPETPTAGTIAGLVWNDLNGDGAKQETESGKSGVMIHLFSGTTLKATSTSQDAGAYQFPDVQPGDYRVCQIVPDGWRQTHPDMSVLEGCHAVTVYPRTSAGPYDFGLLQIPLCGNEIVDEGEMCDQGPLNGQPLHCNASCTGYTLAVCGNTIVESGTYGQEQCDDGNTTNGDGCSAICQIEPQTCHSPLDYVGTSGQLGADGALTLADATEFTKRYQAAYAASTQDAAYDGTVDVRTDGVVNAGDYFCAQRYYGNAGPVSCQLDCSNLCSNPLDYNNDYFIKLDDGVKFTNYYENKTATTTTVGDVEVARYLADLNANGKVDYGDYSCAHDQLALASYQCPIQCAPVCGDATIQRRLGEVCDDGNITNGDGCSSLCRVESNQCTEPILLDYNGDYQLQLNDAIQFTSYYQADNLLADANGSGFVDYGDKLCADKYYSGDLRYSCTLACLAYTPACGDTHKDANEQCDDGNTVNNDGCSASCQIETPQNGPVCGNNVVETGEQCDEGTLNGQPLHCNTSCSGITAAVCGNTVKEAGEQCDDGNTANNDGCSASCQTETVPPAPPSGGGGGGGGGGYFPSVRLYIDKKVTPMTVEPGGTATFTVTLTNIGTAIASYVTLTDSMPAGITFVDGGTSTKTWNWDTLSNGQAVTITYDVKVDPKAASGMYLNQAQATAKNGQSVSAVAGVEVRQPTVAGVETVVPPAPPKPPVEDKVKVLGYEKLPDTSTDWTQISVMLAIISVFSTGALLVRKGITG